MRFLSLLRSEDGIAENASQILIRFRNREPAMSNHKDQGSSETDEPWELPGQSSQQLEQNGSPKPEREYKDNETA